jgi:glycogen debranching enzyme
MDSTVKGRAPTGSATATTTAMPGLQPFLHDADVVLAAPAVALSRPDGQMRGGADGFFHGDRRFLSRLEVTFDGVPASPLGGGVPAAATTAFRTVLRGVGEDTADPAVTLRRLRRVRSDGMRETLTLHNAGRQDVTVTLIVAAAADFAAMDDVKAGRETVPRPAQAAADGLHWSADGGLTSRLTCTPAPDGVDTDPDHGGGLLRWEVALGPGTERAVELDCTLTDQAGFPFAPAAADARPWSTPRLRLPDHRFPRLLTRALDDLRGLLLTDPRGDGDHFLAAGAPWFLTLFGRDSLIAARMLLPLGTDLAGGTLRTLARRQGRAVRPKTGEQPGKILHEIRREPLELDDGAVLPPVYYGTIDATPLWLILLHDAWRWGLPEEQVAALLPHAEAALTWLADHGDADGDGLLEYVDSTGRGLANQGWKDSGDSVRRRDGRLATPPVALSEVQANAYEAAVGAAALLRAFDRPGADRWEQWADRLQTRFRACFWLEDDQGPYCAAALDGDKQPMDTDTSSNGQLLGTGLLSAEEDTLLARRLLAGDLDCGFGLRTLGPGATGFNPLGYHIGSVWPHDTALAVHGLTRAGFGRETGSLVRGLLAAGETFDARLPELFAGHGAAADPAGPAPYPAACRPQAWAAASAVQLLTSTLGLRADVPGGALTVSPSAPDDWRPLSVDGLRVAGHPLAVTVPVEGAPTATTSAEVEVRVGLG